MANEESSPAKESVGRKPCCPLPIALYDSDGILFELYEGGQPYQRHYICWQRLKPVTETRPAKALAEQQD